MSESTCHRARHLCAPVIQGAVFLALLTSHGQPAAAQLPSRGVVLKNARVITAPGDILDTASIKIKGDRIAAVGPKVSAGFLDRKVDLAGKTVTSGLIDAWSALGRLGAGGTADPTAAALDLFDQYARDDFREALRQGVTTVYLGAGSAPGVSGLGVVMQLVPLRGGRAGVALEHPEALTLNLASNQSPIARLKLFDAVRAQFRKAVEYRESLEDYQEELEEYIEKLKERAEKESEEKAGDDKKPEEKKPSEDKPKPDEKGDKDKPKPDPKPEPKPDPKPEPKPKPDGNLVGADDDAARLPARRGRGGRAANGDDGAAEKKDDKKKDEDELKKPKQPKPDRKSEVLLRAIDRELRVRVEAHRSEDILNALQLAEDYNLDLVLVGATDAYLVADKVKDAGVPVVLGPVTRSDLFQDNQYRRHTERNAAALDEAGVLWTVGSGGAVPRAARFVALNAQLAAGHGALKNDWLATVTTRAAKVLGLERKIGRVRPGMRADLVVWSGDPGDPASKVERVYVAGKLAYRARGD